MEKRFPERALLVAKRTQRGYEAIHKIVRDARIFQSGVQRTQAEDLVQNLARQPIPFDCAAGAGSCDHTTGE